MNNFQNLCAYVSDELNDPHIADAQILDAAFDLAKLKKANPRRILEVVCDDLVQSGGCRIQYNPFRRVHHVYYKDALVALIHDHPERYCQLVFSDDLIYELEWTAGITPPVITVKNREVWRSWKGYVLPAIWDLG